MGVLLAGVAVLFSHVLHGLMHLVMEEGGKRCGEREERGVGREWKEVWGEGGKRCGERVVRGVGRGRKEVWGDGD